MLGMYRRFSNVSWTRRTVSGETFPVLPWMTLETVAVLSPNSSAMSLIRTRSMVNLPFPFYPHHSRFQAACIESDKILINHLK